MFSDPQTIRAELIGQSLLVNGNKYTITGITSRRITLRDDRGYVYEVALSNLLGQLQELLT